MMVLLGIVYPAYSPRYLYRAMDRGGNTIESMHSAKRDFRAEKRPFEKVMRADHQRLLFSINADQNAAYPDAFTSPEDEKGLPTGCKLRRVKYLKKRNRARPLLDQKEGAGVTMFPVI